MKAFKQQQMRRSISATSSSRRSQRYLKRFMQLQFKKDTLLLFEKTKFGLKSS
jgi:hypothetical protein